LNIAAGLALVMAAMITGERYGAGRELAYVKVPLTGTIHAGSRASRSRSALGTVS
jgi:hypothetical protein